MTQGIRVRTCTWAMVAALALAGLVSGCGGGGGSGTDGGGSVQGEEPDPRLPRPASIDPGAANLHRVDGQVWLHAADRLARSAPAASAVSIDLIEVDAAGQPLQVLAQAQSVADGSGAFKLSVPTGRALPSARLMLRANLPGGQVQRAWFDEGLAVVSPASEALVRWVLGPNGLPALPAEGAAQPFLGTVLAAQAYMEGMPSLYSQPDAVADDKLGLLLSDPAFATVVAAWRVGNDQAAVVGDLGEFVPMTGGSNYEAVGSVGEVGPSVSYAANTDGSAMVEAVAGWNPRFETVNLVQRVASGAWSVVGVASGDLEAGLTQPVVLATLPLRPRAARRVGRWVEPLPDQDEDGKPETVYTTVTSEIGLPQRVTVDVDYPVTLDRVALPVVLTVNEEVHYSGAPSVPITFRTRYERFMAPGIGPVRLANALERYRGTQRELQTGAAVYTRRGVVQGRLVPNGTQEVFTPWPDDPPLPEEATQIIALPVADRILFTEDDVLPIGVYPGYNSNFPYEPWLGQWWHEWDAATMTKLRSVYVPLGFQGRHRSSDTTLKVQMMRDRSHLFVVACGSLATGLGLRDLRFDVRRIDWLSGQETGRWQVDSAECPNLYPHPSDPGKFAVVVGQGSDGIEPAAFFIRLYSADVFQREIRTSGYFQDAYWGDGSVFRFGDYHFAQQTYRLSDDGSMQADDALQAWIGSASVNAFVDPPLALTYPAYRTRGHTGDTTLMQWFDPAVGQSAAQMVNGACPILRGTSQCVAPRGRWLEVLTRPVALSPVDVRMWPTREPGEFMYVYQQLHGEDPYTVRHLAQRASDGRRGVLTVRIQRRLF